TSCSRSATARSFGFALPKSALSTPVSIAFFLTPRTRTLSAMCRYLNLA
ncbi:MAG: hypothetical protein ACI8W7_001737, partial [Gammaproteobacteria bacterium]